MLPYRESKVARISLILFFLLLIVYAMYEAWGMLYGPVIEIPQEEITTHEQYVLISGHTERITELTINGATVPVTEDGDFEKPHLLAPGTNHIILEAWDARGRKTEERLDILYIADENPPLPPPSPVATTTEDEP